MADFPIRGMVTLTFFKDSIEPVFESESGVLVERWLKLADKALALTTKPRRRHRHRTRLPRFSPFPSRNVAETAFTREEHCSRCSKPVVVRYRESKTGPSTEAILCPWCGHHCTLEIPGKLLWVEKRS